MPYDQDDLDKFADGEPRGAPQCLRIADNGDWMDHRGGWHDRVPMADEDEETESEEGDE